MIVGALVSVKPSHLDGVNLESIYFEAQSYVFKTMLSHGLREIIRGSSQRWYQSHTDCRLEIAWALSLANQIRIRRELILRWVRNKRYP